MVVGEMTRPNPLTDELTDEAKAILVIKFAYLKERLSTWSPEWQTRLNGDLNRLSRRTTTNWWERGVSHHRFSLYD